MEFRFYKCHLERILPLIENHITNKDFIVDSFWETHVLESAHYAIEADGKDVGYFSIHKNQLLTQFHLNKNHCSKSRDVFSMVRRMESIREAFVPSGDEFYLVHCLDNYAKLEKQANYAGDTDRDVSSALVPNLVLERASLADKDEIVTLTKDFFDPVERMLVEAEVYKASLDGQLVGYGIIEFGKIARQYGSIGMIVLEEWRGRGIARTILARLRNDVKARGRRPISACWWWNHNSRKSMEGAGLYACGSLLRIHF